MAGLYGDFVARTVRQGPATAVTGQWLPLVSSGTTPLSGRRHIRLFARSVVGVTLGVTYTARAADGTFPVPTDSIKHVTFYLGGSTWIEPIGDNIQVWGRLIQRGGSTVTTMRVIVTEYA